MDTALRVMRELDGVVESAAVFCYPFLKLDVGVEVFVGDSVSSL